MLEPLMLLTSLAHIIRLLTESAPPSYQGSIGEVGLIVPTMEKA